MPLKCCRPKCVSNYKSTGSSVSIYKLPRDEEEEKKWISVIPRSNLVVSKYTVICRILWPEEAHFILYRGKLRPSEPPCLFPSIPFSCLSPPPPKARKTTLASASKRNVLPDELERFYVQDLLIIEIIPEKLAEELDLVVYEKRTQ